MIPILLCLLGGHCDIVPVPAVQAVVQDIVIDPYWSYNVGEQQAVEQRISKLEEIAQLLAENQRMLLEQRNGVVAGHDPAEDDARAVMKAKCYSCHSGAEPKGGIDLTGQLSASQKMMISLMAEDGSMPPEPNKPLEDEEYQALKTWLQQDKAEMMRVLKGG